MTDIERDEDLISPIAGAVDDKDGYDPTPVDRMVYLLERLVEAFNGYPGIQESVQSVTSTPQAFTNRMRVKRIIAAASTAGTFDFFVGSTRYSFAVPVDTIDIELPIVIENGVDVRAVNGTAVLVGCYLVYTTE